MSDHNVHTFISLSGPHGGQFGGEAGCRVGGVRWRWMRRGGGEGGWGGVQVGGVRWRWMRRGGAKVDGRGEGGRAG